MPSTQLKVLLRERHWQNYNTFCEQYDLAAGRFDRKLIGTWPAEATFKRWLNGKVRRPHPHHCRVLEALLPGNTVDHLFALSDESKPTASPTAPPGANLVLKQAASPAARPHDDVPSKGARLNWPAAPADGMLGEELAMSTDESASFVRQRRGTVDPNVIDQLNADVGRLADRYVVQGPYLTFVSLSKLRRDVFGLLDQRQRPAVLPDLYRIAGQLCVLLAHASLDLGQSYAAETHTRTAWLCADLAEDDQLRTYTRWVQSNVAYWNGEYREAAEIARAGQEHAKTGTAMLRLASQEARAHAAAADSREVERALAIATTARDTANPSLDKVGGIFRFDPGKAAYYASEVRVALGGRDNFLRAITDADEALQIFAAQPESERCPEFVAAAQIDKASAHIALADAEGAVEQLGNVFMLPAENRTAPIAQRMEKIGTSLSGPRFAGSAVAAALRERVSFFGAYTAARELPAS